MALGTTNISVTLVKTALGSGDNNVSGLCTASNINKWSRFKPVRGTYPQANDGKYGFDLANNWSYLKPRGGASEPYRLGDFRQYQHVSSIANKCMPPIHVLPADAQFDNLMPYGGDSLNQFKVKAFRTETDNQYGVLPSLLGIDSYYYGVRIVNGNGTFFKTYGLVSSLTTGGVTKDLDATLVETTPGAGDWHYNDLPQGVGVITVAFIISNTSKPSWTAIAPSTYYILPSGTFDGIAYISGGSFSVSNWCIPSIENYTWQSIGGATETVEIVISTDVGVKWTYTKPTWITAVVGYYSGAPAEWTTVYPDGNGDYVNTQSPSGKLTIRLTPDASGETTKNGNIVLLDVNDVTMFTIPLTQMYTAYLPIVTVRSLISSTNHSASVTLGLTTIPFSFKALANYTSRQVRLGVRLRGQTLYKYTTGASTITFAPIDSGATYSEIFTMSITASYNEEYEVLIENI